MRISDLLLMSMSNLWKRKLRTVLTVLGVVIGVTSIVVMMSLGNGLKVSMIEQIESYGSLTQIEVNSNSGLYGSQGSTQDHFLSDEMVKQMKTIEHVTQVYPILSVDTTIKVGKYQSYTQIKGYSSEGLRELLKVGEGRYPGKSNTLELLFGNTFITDMYNSKTKKYEYWDTGTLPDINFLEDKIKLELEKSSSDSNSGVSNSVIKLKAKGVGMLEGGVDDYSMNSYNVYTEIESLKTLLKKTYKKKVIPGQPTKKNGKPYQEIFYTSLVVQVDDINNVESVTQTIKDMGFSTYNNAEWIQSEQKTMNIIQAVLGAIGAVSLLVAAIGITNTMMMSIYERTKEIGVMKVLGCDIRNIQFLFLTEAGFIGFLGGSIGLILSIGINQIINLVVASSGMGYSRICVMPFWLPILSIIFAIFIGMFSGFIPSLRAMRLSPLAAIRNE